VCFSWLEQEKEQRSKRMILNFNLSSQGPLEQLSLDSLSQTGSRWLGRKWLMRGCTGNPYVITR
jgi:hypothetical protein